MQVIRQYAVPMNGLLTIKVPESFEGHEVEVQIILAQEVAPALPREAPKRVKKGTTGLEKLVGKYRHFTPEQNEQIDNELTAIRNEWERSI